LSNAYGISFVKTRIKYGCLSAFHPLKALRLAFVMPLAMNAQRISKAEVKE
jgi:hypothetical protein